MSALAAVLLLAVALAADSPLHRDDPLSGRPCTLCQFQHLGLAPAVAAIDLAPPPPLIWALPSAPQPKAGEPSAPARLGRAPPASALPSAG